VIHDPDELLEECPVLTPSEASGYTFGERIHHVSWMIEEVGTRTLKRRRAHSVRSEPFDSDEPCGSIRCG
jgi:hypothetical protein